MRLIQMCSKMEKDSHFHFGSIWSENYWMKANVLGSQSLANGLLQ